MVDTDLMGVCGVSALVVTGPSGRPVTVDAVVVVPGVMGSELVDADSGAVRWGLKPKVLAGAWVTGGLPELAVTDADRAGRGRLRASRLLRVPGYTPMLGGIEPYTGLLSRVSQTVVDPRAALEFPYDWRLSIEFNAHRLMAACAEHLDRWRAVVRAEKYADPDEVRVSIVSHSMGGLITRYATEMLGLSALLRRVITLGTPFFGAVKTVRLLATGDGAPVPKRAARNLARTCPGVYDLLPRYQCVVENGLNRRLTASDAPTMSGDSELASESASRWDRLALTSASAASAEVPASVVVGAEQPTLQSVVIRDGELRFLESVGGTDHGGDSTVYLQSAQPVGVHAFPLPQRHGALAKSPEALTFVADKLVNLTTGPPMGTRPVGADIPDVVTAGQSVLVRITGTRGDPVGVSVRSVDLDSGVPTTWANAKSVDGDLMFTRPGLREGLHRVEVTAGGFSAVTDLILATSGS